jgi:bilirubin oxidase
LPPIPAIDTLGPDTTRTILLTGDRGRNGEPFGIDSSQYDFNKINTVVKLNTVEDWVVKNLTDFAHPFHVHLVQFYVMEIKSGAFSVKPGDPAFPKEALGPKDDILIWPGEEWRIRMRFHTYAQPKPFDLDSSAYMYHCHILTHEDGYYRATANTLASRSPWGMMQQFAVWDGTITSIDKPLAQEMTLYPNPAENKLYLNAESPRMSTVRIIDVQGRVLVEKVLAPFSGSIPIDVSDIARGLILVEWNSPDGKQTKKVVLE